MNKIFGSLFNRANPSNEQDTSSTQLQSANVDNNTIQATQQNRPVETHTPKLKGIRAYFQRLAAEREREHFERTTMVQLRLSPCAKYGVIAEVVNGQRDQQQKKTALRNLSAFSVRTPDISTSDRDGQLRRVHGQLRSPLSATSKTSSTSEQNTRTSVSSEGSDVERDQKAAAYGSTASGLKTYWKNLSIQDLRGDKVD